LGIPWTTMKYGPGRRRPRCPKWLWMWNCLITLIWITTWNSCIHFLKTLYLQFFSSKFEPSSSNFKKIVAIWNETMKMQILSWTVIFKASTEHYFETVWAIWLVLGPFFSYFQVFSDLTVFSQFNSSQSSRYLFDWSPGRLVTTALGKIFRKT
jgi:hypothetical protein